MLFTHDCSHCGTTQTLEFSDSRIHEGQCQHCKTHYCIFIRKHKFELLFDLGTRALLDGYAREAVSSFAAAQERCFELYIRAVFLESASKQALTLEEAMKILDKTWKHASVQSERQLGMFLMAYLQREGREPEFLTTQQLGTAFRNKVIHSGYLPSHEEVTEYAEIIFKNINRVLKDLGDGILQAELLQEYSFKQYMDSLNNDVAVVFLEQEGMFRNQNRNYGMGSYNYQNMLYKNINKTQNAPQERHLNETEQLLLFKDVVREKGNALMDLIKNKASSYPNKPI